MAKKYQEGDTINSITLLVIEVEASRYVFYRGRPLHPLFIRNMNLSTVLGGLYAGNFSIAKEGGK